MSEHEADVHIPRDDVNPLSTATRQRDLPDAGRDPRVPGASLTITGDVTAREDVTIEGQVNGTIELADHVLTIGEAATVTAPIVARIVTIRGTATGSVSARERVDIQESGSLDGNVVAPCITLVEGSYFHGTVTSPTVGD